MVQQVSKSVAEEKKEGTACYHHWIIEAPTGPVSRGVCLLCEEIREFKNYIGASPWGEYTPMLQPGSRYPQTSASMNEDEEDVDNF